MVLMSTVLSLCLNGIVVMVCILKYRKPADEHMWCILGIIMILIRIDTTRLGSNTIVRFGSTIVRFGSHMGTVWLDRIDSYGTDSMFKVNQVRSCYWYYTTREYLVIRKEVHDYMHD